MRQQFRYRSIHENGCSDTRKEFRPLVSKVSATFATDNKLLSQAKQLLHGEFADGLTPEDVREVTKRSGVDLATALLYSHFEALAKIRFNAVNALPPRALPRVAIVPGAFHEEYPEIGSDGRLVAQLAEERGWQCERICVASLGSLDENASKIIDWFNSKDATELIVITLSKGAADFRRALRICPNLTEQVCGWICVSGILFGTPIANWLLDRRRFWLTSHLALWYWNRPKCSLSELRTETSVPNTDMIFEPVEIVGFPLRKHLWNWRSRLWHRRFSRYGPTDGVVWLADLLAHPTTVVPIWGADHYMQTAPDARRTLASVVETVWSEAHGKPARHEVCA